MKDYIVISDDDFFDLEIIKNFEKLKTDANLRCFIASTPNLKDIQDSLSCDVFFWKNLNFNFLNKLNKIKFIDEEIYNQYCSCEQIHNKMLDFINPDGNNFTNLEIRRNYITTLEFCLSLIETYKPKFIIFSNIPHSYYTGVLYEICKIQKIPTVVIRETLPKIYIFENINLESGRTFFGSNKKEKIKIDLQKENIKNFANQTLKGMFSFLRNHKIINSKLYNLKPFFLTFIIFLIERFAYLGFQIFKNIIKTFIFYLNKKLSLKLKLKFENPLSLSDSLKISGKSLENSNNTEFYIAIDHLKQDLKKILFYNNYKNLCTEIVKNKKFIYFPLHYQPEATTYPYGNFYIDQINAIKLLSKYSDDDMLIYVKEHPDTFNLERRAWSRGMHSRDENFYKEIVKIKKVKLINIKHNSLSLIKESELTASITGTSSLEAVLNGKQAVVFGDCWYKSCEGVFSIMHQKDLYNYFINKNYLKKPSSEKINEFFRYLDFYSFEGSKSGLNHKDDFSNIALKLNENINNIVNIKN